MARLAVLAVLFVGSAVPDDDGFAYPPVERGGVTARLAVRVAEPSPDEPAAVRLTLTVEGGATLEAEPRLDDPADAWHWEAASSWAVAAGRARCEVVYDLRQAKPGAVPLPVLKLRFRASPAGEWDEVVWADILGDVRGTAEPEPVARPPGRAARGWMVAATGAGLLGVLVVLARRRRRSAPMALSADEQALRELDAVEQAANGTSEFYARLSDVLRRYLAERYGLPAPQRTTEELLAARAAPVPEPWRDRLAELLRQCDRARFAGLAAGAAECRAMAARAREFVRATAAGTEAVGVQGSAGPVTTDR